MDASFPGMETSLPGQRRTRQREALAGILREAPGPLSVQELLSAAQRRVEGIGQATVYRTLRLLEEAGDIRPVAMPGGDILWESAGRDHHHHFQCRSCSRVLDLPGCPVHVDPGSLPNGFRLEGHELTLTGLCPDCAAASS